MSCITLAMPSRPSQRPRMSLPQLATPTNIPTTSQRPSLSIPKIATTTCPTVLPTLVTPSTSRTPLKGLSLFIPPTIEATSPVSTQSTNKPNIKHNYTPVAPTPRPKLSLNLAAAPKRTFTTSGSLSRATGNHDLTQKNTIANTHVQSINVEGQCTREWIATYTYKPSSRTRSILKHKWTSSYRICATSIASKPRKTVSFDLSPSFICSSPVSGPSSDSEDYTQTLIDEYDEDMSSPPSTTSSTDSEESESDNECKTPIDNTPNEERWAKAMPKWRKPTREWKWTLGGDVKEDLDMESEYSGSMVKVWGDECMTPA